MFLKSTVLLVSLHPRYLYSNPIPTTLTHPLTVPQQSYGHDTGGFAGPQPSPALLTPWVQTAAHTARLAINTYKTTPDDNLSGAVTEPWQYPSHAPYIRAAIERRYALLPLLASLQVEAHRTGAPPVRWVGWGRERTDPEVWSDRRLRDGEGQFWLGDGLLVCAVDREADERGEADVYLPRGAAAAADWGRGAPGYVLLAGAFPRYEPGRWARVPCAIADGAPVLAREGSAVPVGRGERTLGPGESAPDDDDGDDDAVRLPPDDYRAVELYPPPAPPGPEGGEGGGKDGEVEEEAGRWFATTWREDDGLGPDHARGVLACTVAYLCLGARIVLRYSEAREACCDACPDGAPGGGGFAPAWTELVVVLPPREARAVVAAAGAPAVRRLERGAAAAAAPGDGRARYVVAVERGR